MIHVKAKEWVRVSSIEGFTAILEEGEVKEFSTEIALAFLQTGKCTTVDIDDAVIEETVIIEDDLDDDDLDVFDDADSDGVTSEASSVDPDESDEDQNDDKDNLPCTDIVAAMFAVADRAAAAELKNDGVPKAFAVNKELGRTTTAEEREAAWPEVQARLEAG